MNFVLLVEKPWIICEKNSFFFVPIKKVGPCFYCWKSHILNFSFCCCCWCFLFFLGPHPTPRMLGFVGPSYKGERERHTLSLSLSLSLSREHCSFAPTSFEEYFTNCYYTERNEFELWTSFGLVFTVRGWLVSILVSTVISNIKPVWYDLSLVCTSLLPNLILEVIPVYIPGIIYPPYISPISVLNLIPVPKSVDCWYPISTGLNLELDIRDSGMNCLFHLLLPMILIVVSAWYLII